MRPTARVISANEVAAYRAVVWTELAVFCVLVWRAVILVGLSLVR